MPRLSRTVVAEREAFATKCFSAGQTVDQVQAALVAQNGHKMNPYRIQELLLSCSPEVSKKKTSLPPKMSQEEAMRQHEVVAGVAQGTYSSKPFTPVVVPSSPISIRDLPTPTVDPKGDYKTIPELIKEIEA
jgi:hypothetical protein